MLRSNGRFRDIALVKSEASEGAPLWLPTPEHRRIVLWRTPARLFGFRDASSDRSLRGHCGSTLVVVSNEIHVEAQPDPR